MKPSISSAAAALGSICTAKKSKASAKNIKKAREVHSAKARARLAEKYKDDPAGLADHINKLTQLRMKRTK